MGSKHVSRSSPNSCLILPVWKRSVEQSLFQWTWQVYIPTFHRKRAGINTICKAYDYSYYKDRPVPIQSLEQALRLKEIHSSLMEKITLKHMRQQWEQRLLSFCKHLHDESGNRTIKQKHEKAYLLKKICKWHLLSLEYRKRRNNTLHWTSKIIITTPLSNSQQKSLRTKSHFCIQ